MCSVSPSVGSGKTRFYRHAESAAARILEAFQSGNVPKALPPIFVRRKGNVPCRAWSWSNQLLAALAGHSDARGYRQWQEVGRHVKKGEKAFHILVPCIGKRKETDPKTGEEVEVTFLYGFTSAPVFGFSQTEGDPLAPADPEVRQAVRNRLPAAGMDGEAPFGKGGGAM
jgi:hypothetical protein